MLLYWSPGSAGYPFQWLVEPSRSTGAIVLLLGRLLVTASGASARLSWVGLGMQHADEHYTGVRRHHRVFRFILNYSQHL